MPKLPRPALLYISILTVLATGVLLASLATLESDLARWLMLLLVAVGIALLDAFPIAPFGEDVEVTISDMIKFASIIVYQPPVAILGIFLGTLAAEVHVKRAGIKKLFNVSAMVVNWAVVAWVYQGLRQPQVAYFGSFQNVAALVVMGSTAYIMNSALLSLVISLATGAPFRSVWLRNVRPIIWQELSIPSLGVFLAVLWQYSPFAVLLAVLPLAVVRNSYQIANHLQHQTRDALRALTQVIDERDETTFDHSERVSNYSRAIAERLGLRSDEVELIASAGLLHDLGKVGMSDGILFNTKILTPDERRNAQRHAEIGAMLLSKFPLFQKGTGLVRHHHERFDGKGYPDGLKGEAIPLGARIICVSDSYQAMTEERPYRHALSQEEAIAQLHAGSGSQFDPRVVEAFLSVLQAKAATEVPASATASQSTPAQRRTPLATPSAGKA